MMELIFILAVTIVFGSIAYSVYETVTHAK